MFGSAWNDSCFFRDGGRGRRWSEDYHSLESYLKNLFKDLLLVFRLASFAHFLPVVFSGYQ